MPTNPLRLKHIKSIASKNGAPGAKPPSIPPQDRHDYCQHNHPEKVYAGKMTEKKRQNAIDIKKREEIRSNKAKLIQIINQKLTNKFKDVPKADIKKLVEIFVTKKSQINATDLSELEQQVRELVAARQKLPKERESNLPDVSSAPEQDDLSGGGNVLNQNLSGRRSAPCTCEGCNRGLSCQLLPKGHEWEAINLFQSYQAAQLEKKKQEMSKKKQLEIRAALDKQVKEAEERKKAQKNDDQEYLQYVHKDLKKFNDENAAKLEKQNAQFLREKIYWEKQMAEEKAARQKEKDQLLREEQEESKRLRDKMLEEKRKLQIKKDREAQINMLILQENAKNKVLHLERSAKEKEEDNRIMQEYADRLDKEEKRRQDAFAARMANLERIVQMADDGPVGKGRREEELREEQLLLKQQLAREEAEEQRRRDDLRKKAERDLQMAQHNKKQLEEQELAKRAEREKDQQHKELYKRLGKEYNDDVARAKLAEQEKQAQQRRLLLEQMESKRRGLEDMNAVERSINQDTLHDIRTDSTFQGRLQHRIRMARAGGSARDPPRATTNSWM